MKKIMIAVDNTQIYNEINELARYDIYNHDIVYKEGVLEYLSKNDVDVIITRDDLEGDMIKELYIKQIRLLRPEARLILFVKNIDNSYLEFLYNNSVFNIININDSLNKENIIEMIEGNVSNLYNINSTNNSNSSSISVVTKKRISVFGTNGAGKSYVASMLANIISKKLSMNTLLMDLDVEDSAIDIYNNLNCNNNILMDIVKDMDNNIINNEKFSSIVYNKDKLAYITNNTSIFDYQSILSSKHYEKIYDIAQQKYDVIVSDIPSNIFLDLTFFNVKNADIITFVINPNYISIRQAIKYLDLLVNVWNIDKNKINLIINKITDKSLTLSQIESLLPGYKIIMQIKYDNNLENVINGISKLDEDSIKEDKEVYKIFGVEKKNENANIKKCNILYNFFKKEEEA